MSRWMSSVALSSHGDVGHHHQLHHLPQQRLVVEHGEVVLYM
jgi:hypothetical protein